MTQLSGTDLVTGADTGRWVAWHRALETARPQALFRDPWAAALAGERGQLVARRMNGGSASAGAWTTSVRTLLIDQLVLRAVAEGADRVVNLAAGFDTRPYRLPLPAALRWWEVDVDEVLAQKRRVLDPVPAACRLERAAADLSDSGARREALAQTLEGATRALVLTEGLLVYLPEQLVRALATELHRDGRAQAWVTDLAAPLLRRAMGRTAHLVAEDARWRFTPAQGVDFFPPLGWAPVEVLRVVHEARRLGRLPWQYRLVAPFDRDARRPWGAVVRLERRPAGHA